MAENNNNMPPFAGGKISNDLSLYADDIDAMLMEKQQMEEEARRANRRQSSKKQSNEPVEEPRKPTTDVVNEQYGTGEAAANLRKAAEEAMNYTRNVSHEDEHKKREEELRAHNQSGGHGMLPISVATLPTRGDFYPIGTKIYIKAASLKDIRYWSLVDDTDLSAIDDALNNIIDSCVSVVIPGENYSTYRDLKEIDRLYLILAIHDFTFPPGKGNDIRITINETEDVIVQKDNIKFIEFNEKIMKYYNPDKLCFSFPSKSPALRGRDIDIYLPSVGVTKWIKEYVQARQQRQEGFDRNFITHAGLLIPTHKGLNTEKYHDILDETADWGPYEWAVLSKAKKAIETAITPKMEYHDEAGCVKEAPLNFRGGIKAIFQYNLDDIDI